MLVFSHAPIMGSGLRTLQDVHIKNGCAWYLRPYLPTRELHRCTDTRIETSLDSMTWGWGGLLGRASTCLVVTQRVVVSGSTTQTRRRASASTNSASRTRKSGPYASDTQCLVVTLRVVLPISRTLHFALPRNYCQPACGATRAWFNGHFHLSHDYQVCAHLCACMALDLSHITMLRDMHVGFVLEHAEFRTDSTKTFCTMPPQYSSFGILAHLSCTSCLLSVLTVTYYDQTAQ